VSSTGNLTNAGALFADDSPLSQSRLYCTRWDGKEKGDAINDAEFTGNVLMLLREAMNFVKSNTKRGWEKLPDGRKNKPEYAERAVLEAMVNHFIHRDYTVMGGEVHLDIYDDRLVVTSPGGMYNGMLIQNLDIADVSSERRNPILANVMAQLDYMEKRGSGLTRICNETKALNGYKDELKPMFKSTPTQFQTTIYASYDEPEIEDVPKDVPKGDTQSDTQGGTQDGTQDGTQETTGKSTLKSTLKGTKKKIVEIMANDSTVTIPQIAEQLKLHPRGIDKHIKQLQEQGFVRRIGGDKGGHWEIVNN
jgi:ATP-dependent DNA helicase RecG